MNLIRRAACVQLLAASFFMVWPGSLGRAQELGVDMRGISGNPAEVLYRNMRGPNVSEAEKNKSIVDSKGRVLLTCEVIPNLIICGLPSTKAMRLEGPDAAAVCASINGPNVNLSDEGKSILLDSYIDDYNREIRVALGCSGRNETALFRVYGFVNDN